MDDINPVDIRSGLITLEAMLAQIENMSPLDHNLPIMINKARSLDERIRQMIDHEIRESVIHLARLHAAMGRDENSDEIQEMMEYNQQYRSLILHAVRNFVPPES